ncbi:Gfo/Idh/MocA family oxidoreductase [Uliginosibacterium sediminicola]|uniref:Gfo/Idh/MocA family oxidoreductase n=1 Tax=Uliginosibacterium sediminicola TaxID=2024550 RepID=A0ABU9Z067_9RHOO
MLRVCIIGASGHYRYVLEGLGPRIAVAGIAHGSEGETLHQLQAHMQGRDIHAPRFDDWRHMLDTVQPDIVAVNCHFGDHARISQECLLRGHHVFSEKPLATTLDALAELRQTYARSGKQLSAMFGIRGKPWFQAAHAAVQAGRIGNVRLMQAQKSYKLGARPAFFSHREQSGGLIPWVGSHAIDWLQWFSGASFRSVSAQHSRAHNGGNGDLEVSAQCLFEMSDEISASLSIDYLRPANAPSHDDDRIRIVGTRGILEVRDQQAFLFNDEAASAQTLALPAERAIFASFVDQIRGSAPCMVRAEEAFAATQASLLAREAADSGNKLLF